MKDPVFINTPAYTFIPFEQEEIESFLELFPDDILLKSMERAVEHEEFEMALIYKDELIKRGKL